MMMEQYADVRRLNNVSPHRVMQILATGQVMKKTRKTISLIVVLLMAFTLSSMFAPPVHAAAFYSDIRVLLTVSSRSADITVRGDYYLKENPSFTLDAGDITVSVVGNRPVITSDGSTFSASSITLISRDYDGTSSHISLRNSKYGIRRYLGNMSFTVTDGSLTVINILPIEHYLYGVVPFEMSNTFPLESLKAQAVCARGYAVANCSKNRTRAYDILDTSADQVYHGYDSRFNRAIEAVDSTAGQVLTYGGEIIQAYYSASNGGQTELTGNKWTTDLPYYVMKDDPYDLKNPDSLEERPFIPAVFNESTQMLMDSPVLEELQKKANKAAGREVTIESVVRVKAHSASYNPPSRSYTKADVVLMVTSADGSIKGQLTVTLRLDALVNTDEQPGGIFNLTKYSLRMRGAEPGVLTADGVDYPGWFLTNRRYGHGIGLSQRGAQQRATDGQAYSEILGFYYVNTQLCSFGTYASAPALTSSKYTVSEAFISGIKPGTSPEELLAGLSPANGSITIVSSKGIAKPEGVVSTGDFVRTVYGDGNSYFDLPVVLYGDTDGNGRIDEHDMDALRGHLLNTNVLAGVYLSAADLSRDGTVDSTDVLQMMKYLNGELPIKQ